MVSTGHDHGDSDEDIYRIQINRDRPETPPHRKHSKSRCRNLRIDRIIRPDSVQFRRGRVVLGLRNDPLGVVQEES